MLLYGPPKQTFVVANVVSKLQHLQKSWWQLHEMVRGLHLHRTIRLSSSVAFEP
jgi:hypothetical protein